MKVDPTIATQAAEWWARLHDDDASPGDQQEFGQWVGRSPERIEAYLRVARLMRALKSGGVKWPDTPADELIRAAKASPSELLALRRGSPPQSIRAGSPGPSSSSVPAGARKFASWWHHRPTWAFAAGLSLLVALAWFWSIRPQDYSTTVGEQRSILLADGSRVTLNSASRIAVEFHEHRRIVRLVQGEALFSVAHDPASPFDVFARNSVVRAIGTEFNVDLREKVTTVTVVEGRVAVISASDPAARSWISKLADLRSTMERDIASHVASHQFPAPPGSLILTAAERVVITDADPYAPRQVSAPQHVSDVASATAWIEHQLVFDHEPLSSVAEQFNRYNHEQIVIDGAELARKEVTGVFESNDPRSFLSFLSGIDGVKIHAQSGDRYVVSAEGRVNEPAHRN